MDMLRFMMKMDSRDLFRIDGNTADNTFRKVAFCYTASPLQRIKVAEMAI